MYSHAATISNVVPLLTGAAYGPPCRFAYPPVAHWAREVAAHVEEQLLRLLVGGAPTAAAHAAQRTGPSPSSSVPTIAATAHMTASAQRMPFAGAGGSAGGWAPRSPRPADGPMDVATPRDCSGSGGGAETAAAGQTAASPSRGVGTLAQGAFAGASGAAAAVAALQRPPPLSFSGASSLDAEAPSGTAGGGEPEQQSLSGSARSRARAAAPQPSSDSSHGAAAAPPLPRAAAPPPGASPAGAAAAAPSGLAALLAAIDMAAAGAQRGISGGGAGPSSGAGTEPSLPSEDSMALRRSPTGIVARMGGGGPSSRSAVAPPHRARPPAAPDGRGAELLGPAAASAEHAALRGGVLSRAMLGAHSFPSPTRGAPAAAYSAAAAAAVAAISAPGATLATRLADAEAKAAPRLAAPLPSSEAKAASRLAAPLPSSLAMDAAMGWSGGDAAGDAGLDGSASGACPEPDGLARVPVQWAASMQAPYRSASGEEGDAPPGTVLEGNPQPPKAGGSSSSYLSSNAFRNRRHKTKARLGRPTARLAGTPGRPAPPREWAVEGKAGSEFDMLPVLFVGHAQVYIKPSKVIYLPSTFVQEDWDIARLPLDCELQVSGA
jgi:hypothetical protein